MVLIVFIVNAAKELRTSGLPHQGRENNADLAHYEAFKCQDIVRVPLVFLNCVYYSRQWVLLLAGLSQPAHIASTGPNVSICWKIDSNRNRLTIVIKGSHQGDHYVATAQEIFADPAYRSGMDILGNHLELKTAIKPGQLADLVTYFRPRTHLLKHCRYAIVTRNPMGIIMIRLMSAMAKSLPADIRSFGDVESAEAWLAEREFPPVP